MSTSSNNPSGIHKFLLTFSAVGVVFAAIGITPLYTLNQLFFGSGGTNLLITQDNVYGAIGFIIWAITMVVAVKYFLFIIHIHRADAGGVFSLTGSIANSLQKDKKIIALPSRRFRLHSRDFALRWRWGYWGIR